MLRQAQHEDAEPDVEDDRRRHVVGQVEVRVEQQQGVSELRVHRSVVQIGWIPPRHVQYEPLNLPCQQRVHVLHYLHVGRCAVGAYDEAYRHFGLEVGAPRRCWISMPCAVASILKKPPPTPAARKKSAPPRPPDAPSRRPPARLPASPGICASCRQVPKPGGTVSFPAAITRSCAILITLPPATRLSVHSPPALTTVKAVPPTFPKVRSFPPFMRWMTGASPLS